MAAHRLLLFSLVSSIAYTASYYFDWALFRYYPLTETFRWLSPPMPAGYPISWYGWLATAILAGATVAGVTTRRVAQSIPPAAAWIVTLAAMVAALLYEKRWFWPLH